MAEPAIGLVLSKNVRKLPGESVKKQKIFLKKQEAFSKANKSVTLSISKC